MTVNAMLLQASLIMPYPVLAREARVSSQVDAVSHEPAFNLFAGGLTRILTRRFACCGTLFISHSEAV